MRYVANVAEHAPHREQRRMINVQMVDFLDRGNAHADPGIRASGLLSPARG
jgi:hypothetical protein